MEFVNALKDIIQKNSISFLNQGADERILVAFGSYCETDDDLLQFQEYKNILNANVKLANELSAGYIASKQAGDKRFKAFADKIEELSDRLEKSNISCFFYSYFIYAYIKYFVEQFDDDDLRSLEIEPVRWLKADSFDLTDEYRVTDEETFGTGRYKESLRTFSIEKGVLKKYSGKSTYVIVPNFIIAIAPSAFAGNKNIRSVYIPESVVKIGSSAFSDCGNLETVVLSKNIKSLSASTFEGCTRLKRINLKNIRSIGNRCFKNCVSLVKIDFSSLERVGDEALAFCAKVANFDFISHLKTIGEEAFRKCSMNYVTLSKCERLGREAFKNCDAITRISIESNIKALGATPFSGCSNVELVRVEGSVNIRVHGLFYENLDTFNSTMQKLTCIKKSKLSDDEFHGYLYLTDVEVMDDTTIPDSAFKDCYRLENVRFDRTITSIGDSAFENCKSLSNLDLKYSGSTVPKKAFYKCSGIQSFGFLSNVTEFEEMSLAYTNLTSFNFNRKFTFIGAFAFANCKFPDVVSLNLEGAKVFPGAFHGLREIRTLKLSSLRNIYKHELHFLFDRSKEEFSIKRKINYLFIKDTLDVDAFKDYKNIRYIEFEAGEEQIIPIGAFKNCSVESIKANGSIKDIGVSAFEGCRQLSNLDIRYGSLRVAASAFAGCPNASRLVDLSKITYFGANSFAETDLKALNLSRSVTHIGKGAFARCYNLFNVTIPFAGESENANREGSKCFGFIFSDVPDKDCNIQRIRTRSGELSFYVPSKIKKVNLLSERINPASFENCQFIDEIHLPNIKVLNEDVFAGCSNLKSISLGPNLQDFSAVSVFNCPSLETILIDEGCEKYHCVNGSVFSKDNRTLYYLNKNDNLSNYIQGLRRIGSWAVHKCPDSLSVSNGMALDEHAIDGTNIKDLLIEDTAILKEECIANLDNLMSLTVVGNVGSSILSSNSDNLKIPFISISGEGVVKILSVFKNAVSVNAYTVEIENVDKNPLLFEGFSRIGDLKIYSDIGQEANQMLGNIEVNSLFANKISLPIKDLFAKREAVRKFQTIEIRCGDLEANTFSDCAINKLKLDDISIIKEKAFAGSIIQEVYVHEVKEIQVGAFAGSSISSFDIESTGRYQMIDSVLYGDDEILYCFDKNIDELLIPNFVSHIGLGVIDSLQSLKSLSVYHENITFDRGAIRNCPLLSELNIGEIKNASIKEIFDDGGAGVDTVNYYGNDIKKKYFRSLIDLRSFNAKGLLTIGDMAFAGCESLESVPLDSAKVIGDMAFYDCKSLQSVSINLKCEHIGLNAFEGCDGLDELQYKISQDEIDTNRTVKDLLGDGAKPNIIISAERIPESYFENYDGEVEVTTRVSSIEDRAFYGVKNLIVDLTQANTIGDEAFFNSGISGHQSLDFIVSVGESAFASCQQLSSISLGEKLVTLGEGWLKNSPIKKISVSAQNKNYASVSNCLIDMAHGQKLIYVAPLNECHSISLDSRVMEICPRAFYHIDSLEFVALAGIESIGERAFESCKSLKAMEISGCKTKEIISDCPIETLTLDEINIGDGSHKLSKLFADEAIPSSLKKVVITVSADSDNFDKSNTIRCIKIPENVEKIPDGYFSNCHELKDFEMPKSCSEIGSNAFSGCATIENLNLENVVKFGKDALNGCLGMRNVTLPFVGADITSLKPLGYLFGKSNGIRALNVLGGLIADGCFAGCGTIETLSLPKDIKEIGSKVFANMTELSSVLNIAQVEKVGDHAFHNCKKLSSISLKQVIYIGDGAFENCTSLTSIELPSQLETIGKGVFAGSGIAKAVVPLSESAKTLKDYGFPKMVLKDVTISSGDIAEDSFDGYGLERIALNDNIKAIPAEMFRNNSTLAELGAIGIEVIGDRAFEGCSNLKVITLKGVKEIGESAFEGSGIDGEIELLKLEKLGYRAFASTQIDKCQLGTLKEIPREAFADCNKLTSINLEGVLVFGKAAFKNCNLGKVTLSDEVRTIPEELFSNSGLSSVNIPANLETLESMAFANTHMKKVILNFPPGLAHVGMWIFYGADSPIVYMRKKQDKQSGWNHEWGKGCKGHGLFFANHSVMVKYLKEV